MFSRTGGDRENTATAWSEATRPFDSGFQEAGPSFRRPGRSRPSRIGASAIAAFLLAQAAQAQETLPGSLGDLVLGFQASSGTGAATNLEVDLGSAADFASGGLTAGTYNLVNLNTDLTTTYGLWTTDSSLGFTILGSNAYGASSLSGPKRSIWAVAAPYPSTGYLTGPSTGNASANGAITGIYSGNGGSFGGIQTANLSDVTGSVFALGGASVTLIGMTVGTSASGSLTATAGQAGNWFIPGASSASLFDSAAVGSGKASVELFYFPGSAAASSPTPDVQAVNGRTGYFSLNSNGELTFTVVSPNSGGPPPSGSRLINISTRALVGTGPNIEIAGFVITGTTAKTVLIRASGPTLAGFGVAGTLPDPALTLYQGTSSMASNTAWGTAANASEIASTAAQVGAFAWTAGSADSAILTTLQPGAYTAEVSGAAGDGGVALVEVYDCDGESAGSKLVNISTRSSVGTGGGIQIAGIVIGGTQAKTVLIRASGPALSGFGVAGTLADPELTLLDGQTTVATNTGWGTAANAADIAAAASQVGAFPWTNGSADSAILVTLQPGSYTAQVKGASGDQGVALVEVYDADGP